MAKIRRRQMPSSVVKGLSALQLESGLLVLLLLRITGVQTSLVAANMRVCSWRTSTEHTCKYVHKTNRYFRRSRATSSITSCPYSNVTPPAVLPTLVHSHRNSKSAGLANAHMDSQKLDAILCKPCSYYGSASVPKWQFQSI